jgi:protein-tyrosine phosphatase
MRLIGVLRREPPRPLALAWVTSELALAPAPVGDQWRQVVSAGIESVADLRGVGEADGGPATAHGLTYASFPIGDGRAPRRRDLRRAARWVFQRVERASPVLIHCREGRGRSVLLACVVLRELGYAAADAYALVRRAQPAAALSDDQLAAIDAYTPSKVRAWS